jgi:hypothetical protein
LESWFNRFKLFRFHAVLHDAAGTVKLYYGKGPGYVYPFVNCPISVCWLGHVSGLIYCSYLSKCHSQYQFIKC